MKSFSKNQWLGLFIAFCLSLMVLLNAVYRENVAAQVPDGTTEPARVDEETAARQAYMALKEAEMQNSQRDLPAQAATPCVNGFAGSYACLETDLMAFMPVGSFSAGGTNDVQGWTDPLDGIDRAFFQ